MRMYRTRFRAVWVELVDARGNQGRHPVPVSYTHLRAHETVLDLVCRLLLEKKKTTYLVSALPAIQLVSI